MIATPAVRQLIRQPAIEGTSEQRRADAMM